MPPHDKKTVTVDAEHYRSLVLAKLRADIAAKQSALSTVSKLDAEAIIASGYWKMGYWKMKYWKMGHVDDQFQEVVLPVSPVVRPGGG